MATGVFLCASVENTSKQSIVYKGQTYVSIETIARSFKLTASPYSAKDNKFSITGNGITLSGQEHRREIIFCGVTVVLSFPVIKGESNFYISKADYDYTLLPLLFRERNPELKPLRKIVIDPGHGAQDPGTQNKQLGLQEKNITLTVSKMLAESLGAQGYQVVLTRSSDVFIPLEKRAEISNNNDADLFISIHCNSAQNKDVRGVEVFCFTPQGHPPCNRNNIIQSDTLYYNGNKNNAWSLVLGYYVQRQLVEITKSPDRGLKRHRFVVLRESMAPSILIEMGFLSNPIEGVLMNDPQYQENIVKAISEGIHFYWLTYQKSHPEQKPAASQTVPDARIDTEHPASNSNINYPEASSIPANSF